MKPRTTKKMLSGESILVTGAAGTIGSKLVERLVGVNQQLITCFDNNETELFTLGERFGSRVQVVFGDVRDSAKLCKVFRGIDIVFHAAALKHVPICEQYPIEAVNTNILGVQNVINAASLGGVKRVIYTSSDKAVNPFNVMGTSKLMGEQLMKAANLDSDDQIFTSTRFGNVLGSRGSVVPIFVDQIKKGGPVTLTSSQMTRFVMTIDDAIELLLEGASIAKGGEIFVTKMNAVKVLDLAEVMIRKLAPGFDRDPSTIEIIEVGERPGEKLFEELINAEEVRRTLELDRHFVILPALTNLYRERAEEYPGIISNLIEHPYDSNFSKHLSTDELSAYLDKILPLEDIAR